MQLEQALCLLHGAERLSSGSQRAVPAPCVRQWPQPLLPNGKAPKDSVLLREILEDEEVAALYRTDIYDIVDALPETVFLVTEQQLLLKARTLQQALIAFRAAKHFTVLEDMISLVGRGSMQRLKTTLCRQGPAAQLYWKAAGEATQFLRGQAESAHALGSFHLCDYASANLQLAESPCIDL